MLKQVLGVILTSTVISAMAGKVELVGANGSYKLFRDGKEYFIEGAGGGGSKALLAELGGNSFRTWGSGKAKEELDEAQKYGQTVTIGHWLGHSMHGFDYTNKKQLEKQKADVLQMVRKNKNHPALLMWALGNEMEIGNPHQEEMWKHINELAILVKKEDPNHPVMTVIAEIPTDKVKAIHKYCPDVDIIGINTYGGSGSIPERWRKAGGTKPYVITEFGPPLNSEWWRKTKYGCPFEMTSTEKAKWYYDVYQSTVIADKGKLCLGSYAFTWGYKVEATPTWYGLLLPDGTVLGAAQALQKAWGNTRPKNLAPEISEVKISAHDGVTPADLLTASVTASDSDGDKLTWNWVLVDEAADYGVFGTGLPIPPGHEGCIVAGQGTSEVQVRVPGGGKYRLYVYCFDGNGNAAYANHPINAKGAAPKRETPAPAMPVYVYAEGEETLWYPTGYMGNTGSISVDGKSTENPRTGSTCMKVSYMAKDNWVGIQWQNPPNDWGDKPGGYNLSKAKTLSFYARGKYGEEKVSFYAGGMSKAKYGDTDKVEKKDIILTREWKKYYIPLEGSDFSHIKTGFGFVLGGQGAPVIFYLDDIKYE